MKKFFPLLAVLVCLVACNSQSGKNAPEYVEDTISMTDYFIDQSIDIEAMNQRLADNGFPFVLKEPWGPDSCGHHVALFFNEDKMLFLTDELCSQDYVSNIVRTVYGNFTKYRVTISEDVVGLDYFLIIRTDDGYLYLTPKFNEQAEPYKVIEEADDSRNGAITVEYASGQREQVECNPFLPIINQ